MKKIFITLLFVLSTLAAWAQTNIKGTVKDSSGSPLAGAVVMLKGSSSVATTTLADGSFRLTIKQDVKNAVIEISFLGYQTQELAVGNRKNFNITLESTGTDIEEVVVVGFGVQQKASITGSISNVGNDDLKSNPTSSVTNALSGRIAGLVARQESGRPGDDGSLLYIRGRSSSTSSSPLVLVDGIERNMSQIPSDDIESVSVLKDASATAVYGVRGANGVILVTTRRGKDGQAKISFSAEYGITTYNRVAECLNAENTSLLLREGVINMGIDPSNKANTWYYGVSEYDNYLYRTQLSPFTHPDNNFVDIFTKNGSQQKYNINISGGTKAIKYYVSVGYYDQDGMFQTDVNKIKQHPTMTKLIELSPEIDNVLKAKDYDASYGYKRMTARSNVDIKLNKNFDLNINLAYIFGQQNRPGGYDNLTGDSELMRLFGMFYRNSPQMFSLVNQNGSMGGVQGVWRQNPLVTLCYTGFYRNATNRLQDNVQFTYKMDNVTEGLSLTGNFSYDASWSNWWGVLERPYIYSYNAVNDTYTQGLAGTLSDKSSGSVASTYRTYGELALRYKHTFARNHNISAVGLATYTSTSTPSSGSTYSYVPHVYKALIGRINYDYARRYLFEVNLGYNGSNRFSKGHRYQLFPAVSAGWVVSNEQFMKGLKSLSFAKLRASYGIVGNDNLGDFSYYYLSSYQNGYGYSFGESWNGNTTGLVEGSPANENITWEKSSKFDIGFETRWFDSKLTFNADYFSEHRTDILFKPQNFTQTAGMTGMSPDNIGIIDNSGYEAELGWEDKVNNDLIYYIKGTYAYAHNTIRERGESAQPYEYMYARGHSIGQYRGYHCLGFFDSYEDIASSPTQFGLSNLRPGDLKYADINSDGVVDENDVATIGYSVVPEVTYSLMAGVEWKGIDLSIMFQGATRASLQLWGDLGWDNSWGNYYTEHQNRWTPETASTATYFRLLNKADQNHQNYYDSDFWVKDASYLRLKNVQIGYTLPKSVARRLSVGSIRIYATGYNLYTWDNIKKADPESPRTNGYLYPQQIVYNFGININM